MQKIIVVTQNKCLPSGVLPVCNQVRQLCWECPFALPEGWLMTPRWYVWASQKSMHERQCFLNWWCVLSKDIKVVVCWAFYSFSFTIPSIWSPGWGEPRLQAAYAVLTGVRCIFHLKLLGFDSDTRHFIRLWIILTKTGLCVVCLVSLWDSCVIFFLKNTSERHPLCFQFGVH